MQRFALITAFAAVALAQSDNPFNRPPADVDKALRARIQEFFGYHVTGDYRKAEALVAEDTKDYFYTHNKPKYMSIEIGKIVYSENFTKATAIVLCEQVFLAPGFMDKPVKVPTPSSWKLEDGKWMWWVDPEKLGQSPFGKMKAGPDGAPSGGPAPPTMATIPTSPDFLFTQVKLDKNQVELKPGVSETVTITNGAPGAMTLLIRTPIPGIATRLDKSALQSGEKAVLTMTANAAAVSGSLEVQVEPIGQVLPIQVSVKASSAPAAGDAPAAVPIPQIKTDKSAVSLKRGESASVTITNPTTSVLTLTIRAKLAGIQTRFDKSSVPSGEKAVLTIKATNAARTGRLDVQVDPTGQILPIQVSVK
jgi:hypothetical protein